jgi:hypothetical protein
MSGHVYVFGVSILSLHTIFRLYFGTVSIVWYFHFICQRTEQN